MHLQASVFMVPQKRGGDNHCFYKRRVTHTVTPLLFVESIKSHFTFLFAIKNMLMRDTAQ